MDDERRLAMSALALNVINHALDSGLNMADALATLGMASKTLSAIVTAQGEGGKATRLVHEARAKQLWQMGFSQDAVTMLGLEDAVKKLKMKRDS